MFLAFLVIIHTGMKVIYQIHLRIGRIVAHNHNTLFLFVASMYVYLATNTTGLIEHILEKKQKNQLQSVKHCS